MDPYLGITCHTVTSDWRMLSFLLHINHFPHPHDHVSIKDEFEAVKFYSIIYFKILFILNFEKNEIYEKNYFKFEKSYLIFRKKYFHLEKFYNLN